MSNAFSEKNIGCVTLGQQEESASDALIENTFIVVIPIPIPKGQTHREKCDRVA